MGRLLFDDSEDRVCKGIDIVAAWRVRGRVPLGVDATANLKEIQLAYVCIAVMWYIYAISDPFA